MDYLKKIKTPFMKKSLHYSGRGMNYWYSKENGGIEKLKYSIEVAKDVETCLKCHKRQKAVLDLIKTKKETDIHFSKGMKCMDCHTAREIHGYGKEYNIHNIIKKGRNCEECYV